MNREAMWAVAVKDMRAIRDNVQVWLPMLIVPVILGVALPGGLVWALQAFGLSGTGDAQEIGRWLEKIPPSPLKHTLDALPSLEQRLVYVIANYLIAPLFLLIPLMVSSVVTADSFAGEKERGTLESLLFAPVDMLSLFVGKALAAFLPAMALSLGTFLLAGAAINLSGWPLFGRLFFPAPNWWPLILLVIPSLSLAAILMNVFISARVSSFQAAYQLGGVLVVPAIGLVIGQATGVLVLEARLVLWIGLVLTLLDLGLLRLVLRRLDRNRLFESQVR